MSKFKWILDAGHGGMLNGRYTTAPSKMHVFPDGLTVYEGVINRKIATYLWNMLQSENIDFALVYDEGLDVPLETRVIMADRIYAKNKNSIYLSIHSNASVDRDGDGQGDAEGFEIFTSKGQTKSDKVADFFCTNYKKTFGTRFKFRSDTVDGDADKEADFYVLRKTDCPALLVENLFFDNRREAEFLLSEAGQGAIAACLLASIKECEKNLEL